MSRNKKHREIPSYPNIEPPPHNRDLHIFGIYTKTLDRISHFIILQMKFRTIGMTALFGVIAAIGFFFSSKSAPISIDSRWVVLVTCVMGVLVTTVFGLIDLVFYENLLLGNFIDALKIEREHNWIPPTHLIMLNEQMHYREPVRKAVFYIAVASIFIVVFFATLVAEHYFNGWILTVGAFLSCGACITGYSILFGRRVTQWSHLTGLDIELPEE